MAGLATALPAIPDLPPPVPGMGSGRRAQADTGSARRGPAKSGQAQPLGMLHRRDLCSREKGGAAVGKTKRGKGTKLMAVADRAGLPVAIHTTSASPHEVTLVQDTVDERFTEDAPERLIGDLAYDSDKLDGQLADDGIEMISPHRENRVKPATQDGRALRRYRRRWKVERLFAWLMRYRRIVTRWEHKSENFLGFLHLACLAILLKRL